MNAREHRLSPVGAIPDRPALAFARRLPTAPQKRDTPAPLGHARASLASLVSWPGSIALGAGPSGCPAPAGQRRGPSGALEIHCAPVDTFWCSRQNTPRQRSTDPARRSPSGQLRRWLWLAALAIAMTQPSGAPLPVVLGLKRGAEHDQLILSDGQSRTGAVLNDSFRLHTSHGPLTIPANQLAALDLTRQAAGIDAVVSVAGDRLSGFLVETNLIFRSLGEAGTASLRRESISKVVFRLRTGETTDLQQHRLIVLRNGDFCTGRLRPSELVFTVAGGGPRRLSVETTESIRLPPTPGGAARVEFSSGEAWEGTLSPTDLEIELDVGLRLSLYSDRLSLIRRWTGWSADLAERIGMPAVTVHPAPLPPGAVGAELAWIPPGEFVLGSPLEEKDRDLDEGPTTRVIVAQGFWIAPREVTQAEFQLVTGRNPSQYTGDDQRPVEKVSWQDAVDYCHARTRREQASGRLPAGYAYRLPTEAEWEYACRAGTTTRFSYGDDLSYLQTADYAWCNRNSDSTTHPVGTRRPNPWGLFDMHGNVWEWCLDSWGGAFPGGTITNAVRPPEGSLRVARGGSWLYEARFCRSANRDSYGILNRCSDLGFRVVLVAVDPSAEAPASRPPR